MKTLQKYTHKVMELISTIKDTWKIFIIGTIISCFMLLLFLNENDQKSTLNFPPKSGESEVFKSSIANDDNPSIFSAFIPPPLPTKLVVAPEPSLSGESGMPTLGGIIAKAPEPSIFSTTNPLSSGESGMPMSGGIIVLAPEPSIFNHNPLLFSEPELPMSDGIIVQAPEPSIAEQPSSSYISSLSPVHNPNVTENPSITLAKDIEKPKFEVENKENDAPKKKCNIFDGKWVYKPEVEPSYCPLKCPFIEEKMSCKRNGRPDLEYEKWVWEARDCDIPMLNGTDMVEKFRNKRIVLVGDSLNRNMWESLSCIMYSNIPYPSDKAQILYEDIHINTFLKVKDDYNFTVEFFWSPFLVELNKNHSSGKRVLVLDKLSPNSVQWPNADIIIFNTGHHWTQVPPKRAWDLFEYKGKLTEKMPLHQAFTRAIRTWANWVDKNIDQKKTNVFFRSISVEHQSSFYNQYCYSRTQPFMDDSFRFIFPRTLIRVIESVIKGLRTSQVKYLNITKLTEYRIDAHPSIYRFNDWKIRTKNRSNHDQKIIPDCGHWCLPGVPDTWNRLLYASLYFDNYVSNS
ncbi:protein trichome birefringence-like 3 [Chenopodium quinoa]|uniref:protein trichome birefringence-like 3 n=1 Tax=Chenopodium quinoa TaxID=63459 RepID=UPI000B77AAD3|nr:protein trichome birefringence-like 3 [Chenopodium quinoa]